MECGNSSKLRFVLSKSPVHTMDMVYRANDICTNTFHFAKW